MQRGRARWARRDRPSRRRTTTPVMPRAGATVAGPPRPLNSRESAGRAVVMATREPARRGLPWPPGGAATAAARSIILRSPSHDSSPPCLPPGRGRGPRPPAPPPRAWNSPSSARPPAVPGVRLPRSRFPTGTLSLPPGRTPPPSSPSRPVPWTGEVSPLPPLRASPTGHPRLDQVVGGGPPGGGGSLAWTGGPCRHSPPPPGAPRNRWGRESEGRRGRVSGAAWDTTRAGVPPPGQCRYPTCPASLPPHTHPA